MRKKIQHLLMSEMSISILSLIFTLYLARFQGATFLGSFVLYTSILSMALVFSKLGLFFSLEKKASEKNSQVGKLITSTLVITSILLIICILIIYIFNEPIGDYIGIENFIFYLIISIVLGNFTNMNHSILKSQNDFKSYANLKLLRELTFRLIAVFLLVVGGGFIAILVAKIISELLSLILSIFSLIKHKIKFSLPSMHIIQELISLARYNAVLEIRALTFSWTDIWMIGIFLEQKFVGIYQTAWQISSAVLIFGKAIAAVAFPQISEWASENKWEKINKNINKLLPFTLLIPIPVFFGSFIFSSDVMLFFGNEFEEGSYVLIILLSCSIFRALQELFSKILVAIGLAKFSYYSSIYSGLLNVILNYFLIREFGIEGAALATTISFFVNFIISNQYIKWKTKVSINFNNNLNNIYASIFMILVLYISTFLINVSNIYLNFMIGLASWTIILLCFYYKKFKYIKLKNIF